MTKLQKRHKLFIGSAILSAEMSYCKNAKVGCVIVNDDRIISNGWNGTLSGAKTNDCEDENGLTKDDVNHAEANAISNCAKQGISTNGSTMYVTMSPCMNCAKLIVQSGVKSVFYKTKYRNFDAINFLREHGVVIEQLEDFD